MTLVLLILISGDLVFIGLHIGCEAGLLDSVLYSLEWDRGYGEIFQYLKELWAMCLAALLMARPRHKSYFAWVLIFGYLLLDDALMVHERVGGEIVTRLGLSGQFGLRAIDLGELAVTAVAGGFLLTVLAICYTRGSNTFRKHSRVLLLWLFALAICGVLVDMLHVAWKNIPGMTVIEDGGELVILSIFVSLLFWWNIAPSAK